MFVSSPPVDAMNSPCRKDRIGWQSSIAFRLAWRNITRDYVRLAIAVIGVGFAVLLMMVQSGLLIGFAVTTSSLIDHAQADLWIVPRGGRTWTRPGRCSSAKNTSFSECRAWMALTVSSSDSPIGSGRTGARRASSSSASIPRGLPFGLGTSSKAPRKDLSSSNAIIIDELYSQKLGISRVGQTVEIMNRRARVVGITSRIRTFTQSPYVFTSLKNAKILTGLPDEQTTYLLVRAKRGTDMAGLEPRCRPHCRRPMFGRRADFPGRPASTGCSRRAQAPPC